jgi:hypothetical protein
VKNQLENYDSSNLRLKSLRNLIIYSQLLKHIFAYLKKDIVQNQYQFMSELKTFNEFNDVITL